MIDECKWKKFMSMPTTFTLSAIRAIDTAFEEYDECQAYIFGELGKYGDNAYKDSVAYDKVEIQLLEAYLPDSFEKKLLSVLMDMRYEYCGSYR